MKLLFVLPLMTGTGGIQSSLLNLLHELGPDAHDVTICVFGNHISDETPLPDWVHVVPGPRTLEYCLADFGSAVGRYPRRALPALVATKLLRRLLGYRRMLDVSLRRFRVEGHFDVAVAYANDIYSDHGFVGGAADIVRKCVEADRRVGWIHNDVTRHGLDQRRLERTYAGFDKVVNVSETCKAIFDGVAPSFGVRSCVVANMLDTDRIARLATAPEPFGDADAFHLVTVARLDNRQKRLDRVIGACAALKAAEVPRFRWHIVGGGPDEGMLRRMATDAGVDDVLVFEGWQGNPFAYMARADVFVLTSDYEAYGMVLAEAQALELPVVCTNYAAASEVIAHQETGLLTELSVDSLVSALTRVMNEPHLLVDFRSNIAARPRNNVRAKEQFDAVLSGGEGER